MKLEGCTKHVAEGRTRTALSVLAGVGVEARKRRRRQMFFAHPCEVLVPLLEGVLPGDASVDVQDAVVRLGT